MQSAANYSPPDSLLTGKNTGKLGRSSMGGPEMCPFVGAFRRKNGICQKSKRGINWRGIRDSEEPIRDFLLRIGFNRGAADSVKRFSSPSCLSERMPTREGRGYGEHTDKNPVTRMRRCSILQEAASSCRRERNCESQGILHRNGTRTYAVQPTP